MRNGSAHYRNGVPALGVCSPCQKQTYYDRSTAKQTIRRLRHRGADLDLPPDHHFEVYRCPAGVSGYHVRVAKDTGAVVEENR